MTGIAILVIHILIVLLVIFYRRRGVIKVDGVMMVMVLCIPFWGALCAAVITVLEKRGKSGSKIKDLESLSGADIDMESMPAPTRDSENIVPLEDALIMDDPTVRRSVMMDVLMQDTRSYIPVLNQARMNDDVEVVHYATTAMASLSKEYELKLQELGNAYAENPSKEGLLDEYINFLSQYISSGMISGQFLEIQQNTYNQLLAEKVNVDPNPADYAALARSLIESKEYLWADTALVMMEKMWPDDERCWLLRFRYYYETAAASKLEEMIKEVSEGGFYSHKIREVVSFWTSKGGRAAT